MKKRKHTHTHTRGIAYYNNYKAPGIPVETWCEYYPSQFLPLYTCPLDFSASQVRLVYTSQRTTHTRSMVYYSSRDLDSDPVGVFPFPISCKLWVSSLATAFGLLYFQVVGFLLDNCLWPLILASCGFPPSFCKWRRSPSTMRSSTIYPRDIPQSKQERSMCVHTSATSGDV